MLINSKYKFFHCILTGIVCILFICSLPVSSFAGYTSNQLSSSSEQLDFYKLMTYYDNFTSANNSYPENYNYRGAFQTSQFPCWGIGQKFNSYEFNKYVYIYYPGSLTMLHINDSIQTYKVIKSVWVDSGYTYTTIGFAWVSGSAYKLNNVITDTPTYELSGDSYMYRVSDTSFGHTQYYYSSPVLKPLCVYNYPEAGTQVAGWIGGSGNATGTTSIYRAGLGSTRCYDSLLGYFHYIDLFTLRDTTSLSSLFDNFLNYDYSICDYVSVFCPGIDIETSDFDLEDQNEYNQNEANNFPWIFNNNNNVHDLVPAVYQTVFPNGGSISTSEIKNLPGNTNVPESRPPYTRPPQTRPDLTSGTAENSTTTNPVVSALDDLTGHVDNTDVSAYNPSSTENNLDLIDELDSAVVNLSSRGNDLSSVCGQAEGFFDSVFDGIPSLMIAAVVCAAICLFIAKVVNR